MHFGDHIALGGVDAANIQIITYDEYCAYA